MPPAKKSTKVLTADEIAARDSRRLAKIEKDTRDAKRDPVKYGFVVKGQADVFERLAVQGDDRAFFASDLKTRVCVLPDAFKAPLVADAECNLSNLHKSSFAIDAAAFQAFIVDLPMADKTAAIALSNYQTLEGGDDGYVEMIADGDGKGRKAPQVVVGGDDERHTAAAALCRYFPAFVFNDAIAKGHRMHSQDPLVLVKATDGSDYKILLSHVLFTKILYGADPKALPAVSSEAAETLWRDHVKDKLFVVHDGRDCGWKPDQSDGFAIYCTLSLDGISPAYDRSHDLGQRLLQQADKTLVQHWIWLTEKLVGGDRVPAAARNYVEDRGKASLHSIDFDRTVLVEKAEEACATWPSLRGAGGVTASDDGRTGVDFVLSAEQLDAVLAKWSPDLPFVNPSFDVLDERKDDGTETWSVRLLVNSSNDEKAFFHLLFGRTGPHDGADGKYGAEPLKINLHKSRPVFSSIAYAIAGSAPPTTLVAFDSEAAAAPKKRTTKKRTAAERDDGPSATLDMSAFVTKADLAAAVEELKDVFARSEKKAKAARFLVRELYNRAVVDSKEEAEDEEAGEATD